MIELVKTNSRSNCIQFNLENRLPPNGSLQRDHRIPNTQISTVATRCNTSLSRRGGNVTSKRQIRLNGQKLPPPNKLLGLNVTDLSQNSQVKVAQDLSIEPSCENI
ncbi:hypothetical protein AXFE_14580 [Acidithrix ferrooxidans]|uniref:Uncharacterized protein n=1 Tax=Acidithrix ferrooxidans TaxID=1280514 RepID=A0A0D8HIB1_9ACTN|nr:hypothetical protein AXFE_14580 [Acidithrix ferrooxidans]